MKRYKLATRAHESINKAATGFREGRYWRGYACVALLSIQTAHDSFSEAEAMKALRALERCGLLGQDTAESFWSRFACLAERHHGKAPFVERVDLGS